MPLADHELAAIAHNLDALGLDPILHLKIIVAVVAPLMNGSAPAPASVKVVTKSRPIAKAASGKKSATSARSTSARTSVRSSASPSTSTRGPGGRFVSSRQGRAPHPAGDGQALSPAAEKQPRAGNGHPDVGAIEKAKAYLAEALAGGPQLATDVENKARRRGVTFAALDSAKSRLGVIASRINSGHGNAVHLALP
jgi:hypothetical protein